ncbi:MAG: hypothetical protein HYW10_05200 [Candidatus Omnitrophica bacterium]|nr:hypothetical protein [Candidatus Omnitrophota bacterium]
MGQPVYLVSSTPGVAAKLTLPTGGTQSLYYLSVKDNDASGGQQLIAYDSNDLGNNTNWSFQAIDLTTGLVGYWKLDNDATDSAGTKHGTLVGTTFSTSAAPTSFANTHSLSLNGSSDYMSVASPGLPTGNFTYSAWVSPTANTDEIIFMASDGAGGNEFFLYIGSNNKLQVATNNTAATSGATSISSRWTHVATTRSGSTVTLYVNGTSDGTRTDGGALSFSTCALLIGTDADSGCTGTLGNYFYGLLDDARVYNRALSAVEIGKLASQRGNAVLTLKDATSGSTSHAKSTSVTANFSLFDDQDSYYVLSNSAPVALPPPAGRPAITSRPAMDNIAWTLPSGDGEKIVYALIGRGSSNYTISDLITLDTTPTAPPSGLVLTGSADATSITATVTAPADSDVDSLIWRYTVLDGNVTPSYPADSTVGTAFGSGVSGSVTASSSPSLTASSLTGLKTYCVRVWAKDRAGNISTTAAQNFLYLAPPTPRLVISAPSSAAQAGSALTLTITAKDASGTLITTYAGPYTLTWTPTGGMASTLVSSSSSGWASGVVTTSVTIGGSSAGTGSFSATDNSSNALTSGSLAFTFYPASFTVTTDSTSLTAGSPFTLTVSAKDAAGATVSRYAGTAALSLSYVSPASGTKGLSASSLSLAGGSGSLSSLSYPDAGSITLTAKDTSYVSGVTIQGTSSTLTVSPAKFLVELLPLPPNLPGPYVNQPFDVTVRAVGADGVTVTPNYPGMVTLTGGAVSIGSLSHAFVPAVERGTFTFRSLKALSAGSLTLTATAGTVTGTAPPSLVRAATLVLNSVAGQPGATLMVTGHLKDTATGALVSDDYSTRFLLTLGSPTAGTVATSPATSSPVLVYGGTFGATITKPDEGVVTVSALSQGFLLPVQAATLTWSQSATSTSTTTYNILQFEQSPGTMTFTYPMMTTAPTGSYYPTTTYQSPTGSTTTTTTTAPAGYLFLPPTTTSAGTTTFTQPTGTFTYGGTKYDAGVSLGYSLVAPSGNTSVSPTMSPGSFFSPAPGHPGAMGASPGGFFFGPPSGSRNAPGTFAPGPMSGGWKGEPGSFASPWSAGSFGPMDGTSPMSPGASGPAMGMGPGYGPPPAAMRSKLEGLAQSWKDSGKLTNSQFDAMMTGIETGQAPQGLEGSVSPETAQGLHQEFNALMGAALGPGDFGAGPRWVPGAEGALEPPASGPPAWFLGPPGEGSPDGSSPFMVFDPAQGLWQPESGPGAGEEDETVESTEEGETTSDDHPASETASGSEPSEEATVSPALESSKPTP